MLSVTVFVSDSSRIAAHVGRGHSECDFFLGNTASQSALTADQCLCTVTKPAGWWIPVITRCKEVVQTAFTVHVGWVRNMSHPTAAGLSCRPLAAVMTAVTGCESIGVSAGHLLSDHNICSLQHHPSQNIWTFNPSNVTLVIFTSNAVQNAPLFSVPTSSCCNCLF